MSIKRKSKITKNPQRKTTKISSEKIKVNFAELSKESQRSWGIPLYYQTYQYECIACGKEAVFSASLQQQWYEEKKKYFWMRPNKCYTCYAECLQLKREIATFSSLLKTPLGIAELTEMLTKLNRFYVLNNKRFDYSLHKRIKKLLESKINKK